MGDGTELVQKRVPRSVPLGAAASEGLNSAGAGRRRRNERDAPGDGRAADRVARGRGHGPLRGLRRHLPGAGRRAQ